MRKLSDIVDNEIIKITKFNTLKTKVDNLDKKIPDTSTLVQINQYKKTDKKKLKEKNWRC